MSEASGRNLSVAGLFADRDARRRSDQEAAEQLQRRKEEELAAFRQRLENFLSWRQAGRYRLVLHLAEERPRSIGLGSILRRGVS